MNLPKTSSIPIIKNNPEATQSISQGRTIYVLGPSGTFSAEAASKISSREQIRFTQTLAESIELAAADPESMAVVPIENSVAGTVAQVQDLLVSQAMNIQGEILLSIKHAMISNEDLHQVKVCYAHPQAWEQSSHFVTHHVAKAEIQLTRSNIDSAERFFEATKSREPVAAIVPCHFAKHYPQFKVHDNIQDYRNNTTRFLLVRKRLQHEPFNFNREKVSLFVEFNQDRSGLLYEMLGVFYRYKVNLCRLESRPSKKTPWFYVFFLDFNNNQNSEALLEELCQREFHHTILGSYDRVFQQID